MARKNNCQISRDIEEEFFSWHVYRNSAGVPDTIDMNDEGGMFPELTEEILLRMLQEIRNPKMH